MVLLSAEKGLGGEGDRDDGAATGDDVAVALSVGCDGIGHGAAGNAPELAHAVLGASAELLVKASLKDIQVLVRYLPVFARKGYAGGTWLEGKKEGNVVTPPFFDLDEDASAFVQACYDHGWVLTDFDWSRYKQTPEAQALLRDTCSLAQATKQQLAQLLTVIIRQNHFADGALAEAIHGGFVLAILKRLDQLAEELRQNRHKTQIREVTNRNTFITLALAEGFNAFLPVYDGGVDFILYREKDGALRKVQLKGRWTIDRKYLNRDIWIAFPIAFPNEVAWFLIPHDEMVRQAEGKTLTDSWLKYGTYNTGKPSKALIEACAPFRFKSLATVADEAAKQASKKVTELLA